MSRVLPFPLPASRSSAPHPTHAPTYKNEHDEVRPFFPDLAPRIFRSKSSPASTQEMGDGDEYRCFIGNLSWSTTDESLKDAFSKFGRVTEAKVVLDKFSGRSRGFAFVTFDEKKDMEAAIEDMNGMDLEGRAITVDKAQPQGAGRDRNGDRDSDRDRGSRGDRGRDYGGGGRAPRGGGGGGDCFKCGKPGHFARECPDGEGGGRGDRYSSRDSRDDRYGGGSRYGSDRGGDRSDRGDDRSDRGGDRSDRGGDRSDRGGDRYSGRSRDGGSGGDRRDRSGPY